MRPDLQYIIDANAYRICPLIDADSFISYCGKRGVEVDKRVLERLEELDLFLPIARSDSWPYQIKIKTSSDGRTYEDLGILEDGEDWCGEVATRNARFTFVDHDPREWIDAGHLWEPQSRAFQKWDAIRDSDDCLSLKNHYSIFQTYGLWFMLRLLRTEVNAVWWVKSTDTFSQNLTKWSTDALAHCKNLGPRGDIPYLCQLLSNRYYPLTQTNQRQFSLRQSGGFEWDKYCEAWDDQTILSDLSLSTDTVRHWWGMIMHDAKTCDPLERWYDFVRYIAIRKREELKGSAQLAESLYHMEHMVRLWHNSLTGEKLPTPSGPVTYKFAPGAETEIERNHLLFLERLANEYNVNPNPRVILVVEGESELTVLPRIIKDYFGFSVDGLGIQLVNLGGVGNFEGKKGYDRDSALVRFVDDYHERGVVAFIVLDNEGRVAQVTSRLRQVRSIYDPRRQVTRPEYVYVWKVNIESDNFSDAEIAQALTDLGNNRHVFAETEVRQCRPSQGRECGKSLETLFSEKVTGGFSKPLLLNRLVDLFIMQSTAEGDASLQRPILNVLRTVLRLAHENYPSDNLYEVEARRQRGLYGHIDQDPTDAVPNSHHSQ